MKNDMKEKLIQLAGRVRQHAYVPYSHYPVGAALLTNSGEIFTGVNVENAAYPTTICAERVAIFKAISEGKRDFLAIAIVTTNGGSPCGSCRQVMAEFNLDMKVLIADDQGNLIDKTTVGALLPEAFTPSSLK